MNAILAVLAVLGVTGAAGTSLFVTVPGSPQDVPLPEVPPDVPEIPDPSDPGDPSDPSDPNEEPGSDPSDPADPSEEPGATDEEPTHEEPAEAPKDESLAKACGTDFAYDGREVMVTGPTETRSWQFPVECRTFERIFVQLTFEDLDLGIGFENDNAILLTDDVGQELRYVRTAWGIPTDGPAFTYELKGGLTTEYDGIWTLSLGTCIVAAKVHVEIIVDY